jgi:hypothetical protein
MTDINEQYRCSIVGCNGLIVPDKTGRPMCYKCGPRDMLPTFYGESLKSEAAMRMGMQEPEDTNKYQGLHDVMYPEGKKTDDGKPNWSLMPWHALNEVQRVMDYGAKKYTENNWMYVKRPRPRYLAAMFRHVIAYAKGEQLDAESGMHHLAHAVCCALFIIHFEMENE